MFYDIIEAVSMVEYADESIFMRTEANLLKVLNLPKDVIVRLLPKVGEQLRKIVTKLLDGEIQEQHAVSMAKDLFAREMVVA